MVILIDDDEKIYETSSRHMLGTIKPDVLTNVYDKTFQEIERFCCKNTTQGWCNIEVNKKLIYKIKFQNYYWIMQRTKLFNKTE